MRAVIYSANFGGYDFVKEHVDLPWADKLYFTDDWENSTSPKGWEPMLEVPEDCKRHSGEIKINSHKLPDHDVSIWVDASVRIHRDLKPLVDWFMDSDHQVAIPKHPHRICTFDEADACKARKKDDPFVIDYHMSFYHGVLPENYGMVATGFIMRKNTPEVQDFNEIWWEQYDNGSRRDQLSVMYASWASGVDIHKLDKDIYRNEYWKIFRHN